MIPRPDGLGNKYQICSYTSMGAPLNDGSIVEKAQKYGLCELNASSINSMVPNDALEMSTIFHRQLRFVQNGQFIDPFVPDDDILAACEILKSQGSGAATYCDELKNKCNPETGACIEIMITPTQAALDEVIPALNKIYGVKDPGDPCNEVQGATFGCPIAGCIEPPKGCTYSTAAYAVNSLGDCCPKMCFAVDTDGRECSANGVSTSSTSEGASASFSWILFVTLILTFNSLLKR